MLGTKLGPYEIREALGEGGMATVYRAYHPPTDRVVAVKVIRASFVDDPETVARFQREARIIAKLEHPHLLPVYDFDATHAPPYIVMRYLAGGTLKERLRRERVPLETGVHLLGQVASALDFAHRQGVVHRDIKPSNIMLDEEGNAFLADFGLARIGQPTLPSDGGLTLPGTVLGTPFYMAPEQVMGAESVGESADVYALGVLLFELLTGRLPFEGANPMAVAMAHVNRPPPRATSLAPHLPPALDGVLLKALEKIPAQRFETGLELARATAHAAGLTDGGISPTALKVEGSPSPASGLTPAPRADSKATPVEQRKLVTSLSLALPQLAESLADEEAEGEVAPLERLWDSLLQVIRRHEGTVESRAADSALVLWGTESSREDDPKRALSCALDLRRAVATFLGGVPEEGVPLHAGITTGLAHLHRDRASGRISSSGGSLLLAGRLARAAPPGAIHLSKETRSHVREAFELLPAPPLQMPEGKAPVEVYTVAGVRSPGGVVQEGTPFRRRELEALKGAFLAAGREGRCHCVTVVAEPGLGKGRLLSDFDRWLSAEHLPFRRVACLAQSESARQPYALLRNTLSAYFALLPHEGREGARRKIWEALGAKGARSTDPALSESVAFLSDWLGSGTQEAARSVTGGTTGAQGRLALSEALGTYFAAVCRHALVVLECSDLQWADEGSLEILESLAEGADRLPLLALFLTRPDLFAQRPAWGHRLPRHTRIDLGPLERAESEAFARELLRAVPHIPDPLVALLVERSEGNPLYLEELVQVLVEDGVLLPGPQAWGVEMERLKSLRIPSTLTGLIQSRLEALSLEERTALQRASVVGRLFWGEAVEALGEADGVEMEASSTLASLAGKGLITRADGENLAFASNLLRDVVLESIPKKQRRTYSARAAEWLSARYGSRSARMDTLLGELFAAAGAPTDAARAFCRAGEQALEVSAFSDARELFERALELLARGEAEPLALSTRIRLSETLVKMGAYREADAHLGVALSEAFQCSDTRAQADALFWLAQVALGGRDLPTAGRLFAGSLDAAGVEDRWAQARALLGLGEVSGHLGNRDEAESHLQTALLLSREMGDTAQALDALNRLGFLALSGGELASARRHFEESHREALDSGCRDRLATALDGLGEVLLRQGDAPTALAHFQDALALSEALGFRSEALNARIDLAFAHLRLEEGAESRALLTQALQEARAQGATESMLRAGLGLTLLVGGEEGAMLGRDLLRHPAAGDALRSWAAAFGIPPPPPWDPESPPADLDPLIGRTLSLQGRPKT